MAPPCKFPVHSSAYGERRLTPTPRAPPGSNFARIHPTPICDTREIVSAANDSRDPEQALSREIRRPIWRTSEVLRAEDEFLATLVPAQAIPRPLETPGLLAQPVALQRRILHAWLRAHALPSIGYEEVEAVRALIAGPKAKTNLPAGWHARRRARKLFLEPPPGSGLSD